jgi:FlaA1/EpsC-like NDP-sugar epimerase
LKQRIRIIGIMLLDVFLISASFFLALLLRFDGVIAPGYLDIYIHNIFTITVIKIFTYYIFRLYNSLWRYASISEMIQVIIAAIISNTIVLSFMFVIDETLPRSVYILIGMLDVLLIGGARLGYRVLRRVKKTDFIWEGFNNLNGPSGANRKRVMIIGAGDAGAMLIKEFTNNEKSRSEGSKIVALIDDDPAKKNKVIHGVPVKGNTKDIHRLTQSEKIDEIIIAIPSATKEQVNQILNECEKTSCKLKILPGIYDMVNEKLDITKIREIQIEDLLGRDEVNLDIDKISDYIQDKRILVTGGGGSIGSELCRQIAKFKPRELVILDIYENNAYDLQNELFKQYGDSLNLKVIISTVRDKKRIDEIMSELRPHIVFHAAAHKHVPLMESNPKDAIKNNVFGTLNLVQAAHQYKVHKFVLISTDKAVNPTNIMGATKRACEMIMQSYNAISQTKYVAVRFGNVLGSNGSVIPLFKKQIAEGGPVTVTHQDIIRYFMTIPEAAGLVIEAGSMARGGELFILDMGEPVKIMDLARKLIRLNGLEPDKDIKIQVTGLRPGEKLFEELFMDKNITDETTNKKIFIENPVTINHDELMRKLSELEKHVDNGNDEHIIRYLEDIVPTYSRDHRESEAMIRVATAIAQKIITEEVAITKERVV